MKKPIAISMLAFSIVVNAQIKVFPGGGVTIGATSSPFGVTHQVVGDKMVFSATNAPITSAPLILGQNSISSSPAFTFWGDHQTGLAHPAVSVLGITIGNSEKFRFNGNGQILNSNASSSATNPVYSWTNDVGTGLFRGGNGAIGFSTSGTEKMRLFADGRVTIGSNNTGNDRLRITAAQNQTALALLTNHTGPWGYTSIVNTNQIGSKNWAVVNGSERFYVDGFGRGIFYGTYAWSDITLKADISTITNALSTINKMRGVSFKYQDQKTDPGTYGAPTLNFGVVAQEIEQLFPGNNIVVTNDNGLKAVNYNAIVGIMIEAMKEQNLRIDSLKKQINDCCTKKNGNNGNGHRLNSNINDNMDDSSDMQSYIKQNKPNPFSNETVIDYYIVSKSTNSSIMVFDMNGKLLKLFPINQQGNGQLSINAKEFSSGLYHYSLVVDGQEIDTKKMIINN